MNNQTCSVEGCTNPRRDRVSNTGRFPTKCEVHSPAIAPSMSSPTTCSYPGCTNPPRERTSRTGPTPTTCIGHEGYSGKRKLCKANGCATRSARGCDGFCRRHWNEATGKDPHPTRKSKPGDKHGELTLIAYVPRAKGQHGTMATFECSCGEVVERRLASVRNGRVTSCGDRGKHLDPRSKGDAVGYSTAHVQRLTKDHGPASDHKCELCGAPARDWAYLGTGGISEQVETTGREQGMPYSTDRHDYMPLCRACHRQMDDRWTPAEGEPLHGGRTILAALVNGPDHERTEVNDDMKEALPRWDGISEEEKARCDREGLCHVCLEPLEYDATSSTTTHEGDCRKMRDRYLVRMNTRAYRERKKAEKRNK